MTQHYMSYMSPRIQAQRVSGGSWGVFAQGPLAAGELLLVWGGRIISTDEFNDLPKSKQVRSVQIEESLYLVTETFGEPTDYVNHSCDPNAGLSGQVALVALHDIDEGSEIVYDYAMTDGSAYDEFECGCGAPSCRGRVTGVDWREPALWGRYAGHFSPYLQRRIDRLRCERRRVVSR